MHTVTDSTTAWHGIYGVVTKSTESSTILYSTYKFICCAPRKNLPKKCFPYSWKWHYPCPTTQVVLANYLSLNFTQINVIKFFLSNFQGCNCLLCNPSPYRHTVHQRPVPEETEEVNSSLRQSGIAVS